MAAVRPPLVLMRCDRQRVTLSVAACARMWLSAADPERPAKPWEGRHHCVGCPVGAENNGVAPAAALVGAAAAEWAPICPRCAKPAPRLINGHLCVSCYNRHREAMVGKNCKGSRPRLCAVLHRTRLAVAEDGAARVLRTDLLVDPVEALIRMAKRASGPIAFSRAPARLALPQLELGVEMLLPPGTVLARPGRARPRHVAHVALPQQAELLA